MDQRHHFGLGENGALGVHRNSLLCFEGQRTHIFQLHFQRPRHGLHERTCSSGTSLVDDEIYHLPFLIAFHGAAFFGANVDDCSRRRDEEVSSEGVCSHHAYFAVDMRRLVFARARCHNVIDFIEGQAGFAQGLAEYLFSVGSLIESAWNLAFGQDLVVFED